MKTAIFAAASSQGTIQAENLFDIANNFLNNAQALLGSALIVVGLAIFIGASWATKTLPGVIGGLIVGGLVAGGGAIIIALSGVFSQTIQDSSTTASSETAIIQQYIVSELA